MTKIIIFALSAVLLLGCGGGDSTKSTKIIDPPPPPPVDETITPTEASRLLAQATFGATVQSINEVIDLGFDGWIDDQISLEPSSHLTSLELLAEELEEEEVYRDKRMEVWFTHAIRAPDQLRQRVAFALSEIMVISEKSAFGDETAGIANYYDILVNHAFGNYRDLLEQITLSPIMGMYLSMLGNEKPDDERNIRPDENYARELMQLFSIGLVELNLDGTPILNAGQPVATYNQDVIKAFAHVYTGWNFKDTTVDNWRWPEYNMIESMTPVEPFHDKGEKQLLNGFVVPANQNAQEDLTMALDNIFQHANVGPFICKQLIQKLVTSNPSPHYVERIALVFNDNGQGTRGDLASVVKAILLDDEARNGHLDNPEQFGKIREPILKATHLWRSFNASSPNNRFDFGWPDYFFAQAPLAAPSVFNFFSPSFAPPGVISEQNLLAPELQIITENYLTRTSNFFAYSVLWGHTEIDEESRNDERILINLTPYISLINDPEALLEELDLLLMAGTMPANMRSILLNTYQDTQHYDDYDRISNLVFLIMVSPQYAVQR